jgi:sortase (surface protein transpeptidase)
MNNSQNIIVGIGIITKKIYPREKVYADPSYNRYTYRGKIYIPREEIPEWMIYELEQKLFYGRGHMKRGKSMTKFPDKWLKKEYYDFIHSKIQKI